MRFCKRSSSFPTRIGGSFFGSSVSLMICPNLCGKASPRPLVENLSIWTTRCRNSTAREISFRGHSFLQESAGKINVIPETFCEKGLHYLQGRSIRLKIAHSQDSWSLGETGTD